MTRRQGKRRQVSRIEARAFIGKAEEWLETAQEALAGQRFNAATGTAIHAGINAADAICGARLGERSAAETHNEAVSMLQGIRNVGTDAANLLSRLLQKKQRAEYDSQPVSESDALAAVSQAERLVAIARSVIGSTPQGA